MIIHPHTKNQVNISNHSEIKWWQLNIWPNFKVQRTITRWKIIGPDRNVNLICNSSLYTNISKNQVNISKHRRKKVVTTKYLAKFQSSRAITRPKIIWPERNVNLICNSSLCTHIPKIKSISPSIAEKKVVTTKYLAIFQSPRGITRPKITGPERNVNLICDLSLYTHIPNIKSISQSITNKSGDSSFISEFRIWGTLVLFPTFETDQFLFLAMWDFLFSLLRQISSYF